MAKRFAGFTPEQLGKIVPEMAGMQSDEQAKFLAATPSAAARVNMMSEKARAAIESPVGFAPGGYVWAGQGEDRYKVAAPGYRAKQVTTGGGEDRQTKTVYEPIPGYAEAAAKKTAEEKAAADKAAAEKAAKEQQQYDQLQKYETDLTSYYGALGTDAAAVRPTAPDFYTGDESGTYKNPYEKMITETYQVGSGEDRQTATREIVNPKWQEFEDTEKGKLYTNLQDLERKSDVGDIQYGGATEQLDLEQSRLAVQQATSRLQNLQSEMARLDPEKDADKYALYEEAIAKQEAELSIVAERLGTAEQQYKLLNQPSTAEMLGTAVSDPGSMVTEADVETIDVTDEQKIAEGTGEVTGDVEYTAKTAAALKDVKAPKAKKAPTVDAITTEEGVRDTLAKLEAATGKPSAEALADAATMSPEQLAQLGLTAAQIEQAVRVEAPQARTLQEGELISGSSVDMGRVEEAVNFEAATGAPSSDATVQGQLTGLMKQFEEGSPPPSWAAGAMRQAAAAMAARGLGASSLAGQAIVQSAMESAMPIAAADAATVAKFEAQNLSNKQQAALFAAEQRANFLNLEFNQDFQAKVANAAKITEIANTNYAAEVQIALENSRNAQTVQVANLNAQNAKILADAAALTQMDMANLNNRQQTQVMNAKAFLDMDMANLNNEQQTQMFKAQSMVSALFSDQAAQNAANQFNASSEMQVDQFYSNLAATVSMFNAEQKSVLDRFNAGELNTAAEFNATIKNMREQFNAQNSLIVEQANAKWMQEVSTADTAAQNLANRDAAQAATEMTSLAFNALLQEARDIMSFAWQTENNNADRATQLAISKIQSDDAKAAAAASRSSGFFGALGNIAATVGAAYIKSKAPIKTGG